MTETILTDRYPVLRDEVALLLQEGKARAVAAVERETLRTYHAIGGAVSEYLLARPAAYGEQTVTRLAADVGLGKATLYQAVAFYRFRPKLYTRRKLVWSHYRAILRLRTDQERQAGERAASKHGWSVRELEGQIRSGAFDGSVASAPEVKPAPQPQLLPCAGSSTPTGSSRRGRPAFGWTWGSGFRWRGRYPRRRTIMPGSS